MFCQGGETAEDQKIFNVRLPIDQLRKCRSGLLRNAKLQFPSVCDTVNLFVTYANVSSAYNSVASERPLWFRTTLNVSPLLGRWHTQVSSEWHSPGNLLSFCKNTLMMTQLLQASVSFWFPFI